MANILKKRYGTEINRWLALIKLSEAERKEKQPNWDLIDKYFRGWQWNKDTPEGYQVVTVNMVYSTLKVIVPTTYLRYPKLYFSPASPVSVEACRLLEKVLNADMRRMKLKEVNKRCIQDVVLYGTAFTKTTFEVDEGYVEYQTNKDQIDALLTRFNDMMEETDVSKGFSIPKAKPLCLRISPRDVGFAVGATDIDDPGFISQHATKRVSSIKNNPRYINTKDLRPTGNIRSDLQASLGQFVGYGAEEYLDICEVYEVWDVEKQRWFTIVEGHDQYISEVEDNPYPYDHPFDKLVTTPLEDQMWGLGEIEPWLPQQDELNLVRTQQANHNKRFNRKYGALENAFVNEEEKAKLERGEDGTIVTFRANRPIREQFTTIDDAQISPDVYRFNAIIEDDIVKISRTTPNRRGAITGSTATESNLAESAAQIGDYDRVDAVGEFTLNQLEKVRLARRAFTVSREIIDITGNPLDVERWKYWTGDDIDVHSMMQIEYGSTQPVSDTKRKADAIAIYDRAMANPTINPQTAFTKLLESFGEPDLTSYFLPNELLQVIMLMKAMGAAKENKGISPNGNAPANNPGSNQPEETPAELRGRAAPTNS